MMFKIAKVGILPHTRKEIFKIIKNILVELEMLEEDEPLEEETGLLGKGIGLDSIETIQLVSALEEELDLTINDEDLLPDYFNSIADLINFLQRDYLT